MVLAMGVHNQVSIKAHGKHLVPYFGTLPRLGPHYAYDEHGYIVESQFAVQAPVAITPASDDTEGLERWSRVRRGRDDRYTKVFHSLLRGTSKLRQYSKLLSPRAKGVSRPRLGRCPVRCERSQEKAEDQLKIGTRRKMTELPVL